MIPGNLEPNDRPLVFIAACEPSADLHAASLIRAVAKVRPEVHFVGVAGPAMQQAGCRPIFDMTPHSAMLLGAVRAVGPAVRLLAATRRHLRQHRFAAAVVVNSPTLNLPIARQAKRRGIPVLYYIAPQLWAWGRFRARRLRRRVDRLAVILPFEEKYFRDHRIDATYVGHPLVDSLAQHPPDPDGVASIRARGDPVVAILPGSRQHVVQEVFPGQLEVVGRIVDRFGSAHVGVSVANPVLREAIEARIASSGLAVTAYQDRNAELLTAADLALVASGTATLEVAYRHTPMIVMYNASRWGYRLVGRWFISTPYLSLVNILAGRELVPEFMPYYTSTRPIAERALALLSDLPARRQMSGDLAALIDSSLKSGASQNTAGILLAMIDERQ